MRITDSSMEPYQLKKEAGVIVDDNPGLCLKTYSENRSLELHIDFKAFSIFARKEGVGLIVADDFSFAWIPFESAP